MRRACGVTVLVVLLAVGTIAQGLAKPVAVGAAPLLAAGSSATEPIRPIPPPRPIDWLAAGDSYSAGFGLPGVDLASTPCARSPKAWPALTKKMAEANGYSFRTYLEKACTGAVVSGLLDQRQNGDWDLITFSIGGNDVGFADALIQCVIGSQVDPTNAFSWISDPVSLCPSDKSVRDRIATLAKTLPGDLGKMADVATPGGNVVVVGYPAIFETFDKWNLNARVWGRCHGVDRAGVERIRGWAGLLNATIGQAVATANSDPANDATFTFVNVNDGAGNNPGRGRADQVQSNPHLFEAVGSADRHNLCGSDSWTFGVTPEDLGLFHPTETGHDHEAQVVATTLAGLDWSKLDASPSGIESVDLENSLMPTGSCGDASTGWPHSPIQLHDGEGSAVAANGDFGGASIQNAGVIGYADFDQNGTTDALMSVTCFGSPPEQCCAGRASILTFALPLQLDGGDLKILGHAITGTDDGPGTGRRIDSIAIVGITVVTSELVIYPEQESEEDLGYPPTEPLEVTYTLQGNSWVGTHASSLGGSADSSGFTAFQTPSGNIGCFVSAEQARCDIAEHSWAPPPEPDTASCRDLTYGDAIQVREGRSEFICYGDTQLNPSAHIQPYGSVVEQGSFECRVETSGVECTDRDTGHGFEVSKATYRLF